MPGEIRIPVRSELDVTTAVMRAAEYCRECGMSEIQWRLVATAVSELARNIVKYAERGSVRVREVRSRERRGIEIVAEDSGPGIADVDKAMQDAYSTAGTLGLGLPGVKRMMDEFELASEPGSGLRVVARKWV